jgi:hypothetical protein
MPIDRMKKVVEYQVYLDLRDRGLTVDDIGPRQYQKELYNMAIRLLVELH